MTVRRSIAWVIAILVGLALVFLVAFMPVIAAIVFVGCVSIVAAFSWRQRGFWSGVKVFIKDILFGW